MAKTTINVHTVVSVTAQDKIFDGFVAKTLVITTADGTTNEIDFFSAAPLEIVNLPTAVIQPAKEAA